ncbi:MAG TPA: hypothetical protein VKK31_17545 [Thermoanaerobaculia bacterium]|nr:hypothetical protein [Thermoanaerobaculia bacterium]
MKLTRAARCVLDGQELFSKKRDEVIQLLISMLHLLDYPEAKLVVSLTEDNSTRITCQKLSMDFYFDDAGLLEAINWSPIEAEDS